MLDHVERVSGLSLLCRKQIRRKRARNIKPSGSKADFLVHSELSSMPNPIFNISNHGSLDP
jgi:hypothetical protein